ncbi:MAG: hypothetical protein JXA61_05060 [Bacteroidales bacterium]|nr:hypothetical protein [Bacteroidales bacterium]
MPDRLEKYIRKNRDQFDQYEPDPGIWKKIELSIRPKSRKDWRIVLIRAAGVAAIFVLVFLISEFIHRDRKVELQTRWFGKRNKEIVIPELKEAEAYYASIVNEKLEQMRSLITDHPDIEKELQYDFSELDSMYLELKDDLRDNVASQEVINAIIENYRLRIDILEDILMELDPEYYVAEPKKKEYDL